MVVREGYKQTEIGVIPKKWSVEKMGDIGQSIIGLTYTPSAVKEYGTLVLRSSNVQNNKLAFKNNVFVDMDIPERVITKENDILICVRNGSKRLIGKAALIDAKTAGSAFGAFMSIYRSDNGKFMFHQFQSAAIQKQINEVLGATINQITNKDLNNFIVAIPPKPEQKAIAKALSDVDALMASLEQLISKKQLIKQCAMQELLTGKRRLPGFEVKRGYKQTEIGRIPEDWIATTFENVLDGFSSGMTPYRGNPEYYTGDIRWITSGELNYNVIYDTIEKITGEAVKKTSLKILPIGTFLMAITGLEAAGTRGSCGIVGAEATTNQSCMAIYPTEKLSTEYLYQFYVKFGDYKIFRGKK